MSLQAVELHSADEVRAHARLIEARKRTAYGQPKIVLVECELEAVKQQLSDARLERDNLREENDALRTKLVAITGQTFPAVAGYPTIDQIQREICKYFGISRIDLISERRSGDTVYPRQIAIYLTKTMTLKSLPEIGRWFGGRDHTTVLHSCRKIDRDRKESADVDSTVENLKKIITAGMV